MAGRFPWFPFLVEDWLSSELYNTEDAYVHGVFWDSIALCWSSSSCSISGAAIRRLAERLIPSGVSVDDGYSRATAATVEAEFIPHPDPSCDGLLTHPKIYELWLERVSKSESAKARGALGGRTKARSREGVAIAKPKGSDPEPDPELEKKGKKTPLPPKGGRAFGPLEVVALFRKLLPELPQPKVPLGKTLRSALNTALRRDGAKRSAWEEYFRSVREMPFLMGQKTDFRASLPWLIGPKNRAKVEGGQYRDKRFRGPVAQDETFQGKEYEGWHVHDTDG